MKEFVAVEHPVPRILPDHVVASNAPNVYVSTEECERANRYLEFDALSIEGKREAIQRYSTESLSGHQLAVGQLLHRHKQITAEIKTRIKQQERMVSHPSTMAEFMANDKRLKELYTDKKAIDLMVSELENPNRTAQAAVAVRRVLRRSMPWVKSVADALDKWLGAQAKRGLPTHSED